MHIVIINGSPRTSEFSNTYKILQPFIKGLEAEGATFELYSLSNFREWDSARDAFLTNDKIIFALPMYVESIPSLMLEFLDTLPTERNRPADLAFILHGGFDEGYQFRLCEKLLKSITVQLGCNYGGCLIKGGSFMLRLFESNQVEKMTKPYIKMGRSFVQHGNFLTPEVRRFLGPECFPWLVRQLSRLFLRLVINRKFEQFAKDWGCLKPLGYKPY